MGQYFKFVNPDREESIELPGPMKLIERVTSNTAGSIITYMLFDGPCDGTVLTYRDDENLNISELELQQGVDELIESEPGEDSVYYDEESEQWKRDRMRSVVIAGYEISDAMKFCGRWAGEDVRLVGDYSETGLYGEARQKSEYRRHDGTKFTGFSRSGPVTDAVPGDDTDGRYNVDYRDEITRGDVVNIRDPETHKKIFAEYIGEADNKWTDITDEMLAEMRGVVGDDWFMNNIAERYHNREFDTNE